MSKVEASTVPEFGPDAIPYELDFYAWLNEQAGRLRALRVAGIDSENLAEEIEAVGRSEKRELASRLGVLLMHLVKWSKQPGERCNSWRGSIREQRNRIEMVLEDSPSLRPTVPAVIKRVWEEAVDKASTETTIYRHLFPSACPWTAAQVLDVEFLP